MLKISRIFTASFLAVALTSSTVLASEISITMHDKGAVEYDQNSDGNADVVITTNDYTTLINGIKSYEKVISDRVLLELYKKKLYFTDTGIVSNNPTESVTSGLTITTITNSLKNIPQSWMYLHNNKHTGGNVSVGDVQFNPTTAQKNPTFKVHIPMGWRQNDIALNVKPVAQKACEDFYSYNFTSVVGEYSGSSPVVDADGSHTEISGSYTFGRNYDFVMITFTCWAREWVGWLTDEYNGVTSGVPDGEYCNRCSADGEYGHNTVYCEVTGHGDCKKISPTCYILKNVHAGESIHLRYYMNYHKDNQEAHPAKYVLYGGWTILG